MPQVPWPPQADGRKISCEANVESSESPVATDNVRSPSLMSMVTSPDEVSLALAYRRSSTSNNTMTSAAMTAIMIVVCILSLLNR